MNIKNEWKKALVLEYKGLMKEHTAIAERAFQILELVSVEDIKAYGGETKDRSPISNDHAIVPTSQRFTLLHALDHQIEQKLQTLADLEAPTIQTLLNHKAILMSDIQRLQEYKPSDNELEQHAKYEEMRKKILSYGK